MLLKDSVKWKCYLVQYYYSVFDALLRGITQSRTPPLQSKAAASFSDSSLLVRNIQNNPVREQRKPSHVANK